MNRQGWTLTLLTILALSAVAGCRSEPAGLAPQRSLVLVTIDTLRADHVGAYGYPRDTTPFLDRLAAQGILFEDAVSASSHTAPSHASLMTSRQPFQHGLLKNGNRLPSGNRTLADLLSRSGFQTAAFTSVSFLVELGQGFDHIDAEWRSGDRTVDAAIAWLDGRDDISAPFFLWVHLYDPHRLRGSRENLQEDAALLRQEDPERRRRFDDLIAWRGRPSAFYPSPEEFRERYDLYDAGIRFADRQVARLYHRVQEADPRSRWIVTSDHGEGLGNHGYDGHGKHLYEEQIRVPLIVAGVEGPPRRVRRQVRLVDVYPTVAAWIGRPRPEPGAPTEQGYPLFSEAARAGDLPPRLAFSQRRPKDRARHRRDWEEGEVYSLRGAGVKYIYHSNGPDELFDLASDPLELDNRVHENPERSESLRTALLSYVERSRRAGVPADEEDPAREHEAELRALGYL